MNFNKLTREIKYKEVIHCIGKEKIKDVDKFIDYYENLNNQIQDIEEYHGKNSRSLGWLLHMQREFPNEQLWIANTKLKLTDRICRHEIFIGLRYVVPLKEYIDYTDSCIQKSKIALDGYNKAYIWLRSCIKDVLKEK